MYNRQRSRWPSNCARKRNPMTSVWKARFHNWNEVAAKRSLSIAARKPHHPDNRIENRESQGNAISTCTDVIRNFDTLSHMAGEARQTGRRKRENRNSLDDDTIIRKWMRGLRLERVSIMVYGPVSKRQSGGRSGHLKTREKELTCHVFGLEAGDRYRCEPPI